MEGNQKHIGERGESFNDSYAERATNSRPDVERIRKYDIYRRNRGKDVLKEIGWTLLFLGIALALVFLGYKWWSLIPWVAFLFKAYVLLLTLKEKPGAAYTSGLLIPGVIAQTHPLKVVAMASVNMNDEKAEIWGAQCLSLDELPGHELKVGEKVPCAAVFSGMMPFAGIYIMMMPRPLVWGFADMELIRDTAEVIDPKEWDMLSKIAPQVLAHKNSQTQPGKEKLVYFDSNLVERTEDEIAEGIYPDRIMEDLRWSFLGKEYESYEEFVEEVDDYNTKVNSNYEPGSWKHEAPVLYTKKFYLDYSFRNRETDEEQDMHLTLEADNDKYFTAGEILLKVHNSVVEDLDEDDKHFFQGISLYTGERKADAPIFSLNLGS